MEAKQLPKPPPHPRRNSYRAEGIIAEYGSLAAFMEALGPKAPFILPDLKFSAAENQRMDQLLAKETAAARTI